MATLLTIGEISRRSGVAPSALRFYEERGLISAERATSSHRRYARAVLRRIAFVVFAQRIGLTLSEISAELAKLPSNHTPNGHDWSRLSRTWTARIDERIAELERLRVGLT
ncbi:MAG: redox-sensitive transcriptional activator SoxR, partial [Vicinamibacterales bacterium]